MDTRRFQGIGMTSERTRRRLVDRLRERGVGDERVLEAIRATPRHLFLDEALASRAYEDSSLPIGHGQTLSQPYIVARMTETLLAEGVPDKVLEVGTGSGYQAAILAQLVPQVYSIERIRLLHDRARRLLQELKLYNARLRHGDGFQGWPAGAPFDAILLTAAPSRVPPALLEQLAPGGRLVAPEGDARQALVVYRKGPDGLQREHLEDVTFVPMLGGTQ
ncbi:protein-L-isoaspartate(D-aspartate) O-methyltransferase [Alkalilimnicola sp. S0819]|uniref:protein-L-isoaspartate(D-aspartate) O-methyltransferase n=1 Tax=Alkalilimnicola sp. S0819 TaxID=2613922 RepID=UPI0012624BA3|nr:protein-L-isoaspartate(D-aspartate) O-methyltransferase [Alkalilimnicola sp. S0819]KAB7627969.1 protein-L-isoaspartate(D-aspartate) O-methyltransferase [Alkalilimnicola sp. S0819]MPQ15585.1 protein-L-isoaspartate(D-aspartate) O-methyltransferase [Alkalilimnicola sp. S0819]